MNVWRIRGKIIRTVLCCIVLTVQQAEMRMIRWMCGVKVTDRFTCCQLRKRLGIDDIIAEVNSGQLSLLPSAGQEMSTSRSAVMICGWGVKACMVHSTCG